MRIGLIINILMIFLIIFYTLFMGLIDYFIKWRIKSMSLNYSWSGTPKPSSNINHSGPSNYLTHEIRDDRAYAMPRREDVHELLNFDINLPIIQYENNEVNSKSYLPNPPS